MQISRSLETRERLLRLARRSGIRACTRLWIGGGKEEACAAASLRTAGELEHCGSCTVVVLEIISTIASSPCPLYYIVLTLKKLI